jgi:hypothetical protein
MRVAVMATGALGGYFGGRLAEAGHEVFFIARGANLAAIRKNGLRVESPLGNIHIKSPKATDDPKEVGEVDLVLFAVKLWDVEKSGEAAKPLVGKNTRLLCLLNGIDSVERLAPVLVVGFDDEAQLRDEVVARQLLVAEEFEGIGRRGMAGGRGVRRGRRRTRTPSRPGDRSRCLTRETRRPVGGNARCPLAGHPIRSRSTSLM